LANASSVVVIVSPRSVSRPAAAATDSSMACVPLPPVPLAAAAVTERSSISATLRRSTAPGATSTFETVLSNAFSVFSLSRW
jgi:hypothetical protein